MSFEIQSLNLWGFFSFLIVTTAFFCIRFFVTILLLREGKSSFPGFVEKTFYENKKPICRWNSVIFRFYFASFSKKATFAPVKV